jgi:hypothetical protein
MSFLVHCMKHEIKDSFVIELRQKCYCRLAECDEETRDGGEDKMNKEWRGHSLKEAKAPNFHPPAGNPSNHPHNPTPPNNPRPPTLFPTSLLPRHQNLTLQILPVLWDAEGLFVHDAVDEDDGRGNAGREGSEDGMILGVADGEKTKENGIGEAEKLENKNDERECSIEELDEDEELFHFLENSTQAVRSRCRITEGFPNNQISNISSFKSPFF